MPTLAFNSVALNSGSCERWVGILVTSSRIEVCARMERICLRFFLSSFNCPFMHAIIRVNGLIHLVSYFRLHGTWTYLAMQSSSDEDQIKCGQYSSRVEWSGVMRGTDRSVHCTTHGPVEPLRTYRSCYTNVKWCALKFPVKMIRYPVSCYCSCWCRRWRSYEVLESRRYIVTTARSS